MANTGTCKYYLGIVMLAEAVYLLRACDNHAAKRPEGETQREAIAWAERYARGLALREALNVEGKARHSYIPAVLGNEGFGKFGEDFLATMSSCGQSQKCSNSPTTL
ncbi:hypothetical protein CIP107534_00558 [Corynebacterium diphtheriae]|uniref:hypothetical protein n=1 Tax=Corynebacterium diphtheriae TaxID=1717 RepID=UPI0013C9FD13|nr:hypothetical protein [Corynebacterium diphtheriae]CAB0495678.1 hypothetical protein CIP107506_00529 [Corynebacterium diphtheriae]CAB0550112.1 hypothetical protein CIP107534_00558 [Corynebacterium diphtheriae]